LATWRLAHVAQIKLELHVGSEKGTQNLVDGSPGKAQEHILPQLMLVMKMSKTAFAEVFRDGALLQLTGLTLAMNLLVIVLGVILFPYLWKD
jgi:hypothetical protein